MMKYLLHTLSCLLLFAAGTCLAQTPGHTLRSGGIDRTYRLHLPEGLPDGAPLVIVLHGYGGQGDPERFDMNRVADRHGGSMSTCMKAYHVHHHLPSRFAKGY